MKKLPEIKCYGRVGPDGFPIESDDKENNEWLYDDLVCVIQYPKIKLCSIIESPIDKFRYLPEHEECFDAKDLKYTLYAAKHDILAIKTHTNGEKISAVDGKVIREKIFIPRNLIVFAKENINYAALKLLMYDDRYIHRIDIDCDIQNYIDGLTFGYSDPHIKDWYLSGYLGKQYEKMYGEEDFTCEKREILLKTLNDNGKLDKFYKKMDKIEKRSKQLIQDTFKSKEFNNFKKEIKNEIITFNELIPKVEFHEDFQEEYENWFQSLLDAIQ